MSGISFNPDAGNGKNYKLTSGSGNGFKLNGVNSLNIGELLSKAEGKGISEGNDPFDFSNNETSITDKDGNLKLGVDVGNVLNKDGTLKPGWSVDENGVPKFSKEKALNMSIKPVEMPVNEPKERTITIPAQEIGGIPIKESLIDVGDFGYNQQSIPGAKTETGYDKDPGFDNKTKLVLKYEVQNGKLVSTEFITKDV